MDDLFRPHDLLRRRATSSVLAKPRSQGEPHPLLRVPLGEPVGISCGR
jgi:hypothetical protein